MHQTVVVNVVGLTTDLLSAEHTPSLWALAKDGAQRPIETILPAATCSVRSTFLTGVLPSEHGIVGNGWYFRDVAEVWETAKKRDASFTCAQMFWWFNMHSSADVAVTPRPLYPSDGRKIPDIYTEPKELRDELIRRLGQFPLFHFWGPKADIISTDWIASSSLDVFDRKNPTLSLIYLPHLDYNLQRLGPDDPKVKDDVRAVDGGGETHREARTREGRARGRALPSTASRRSPARSTSTARSATPSCCASARSSAPRS